MTGIYKILNTTDNKFYIGSAVNIQKRWDKHKYLLCSGKHHAPYLQHAWDKYGESVFRFEVIVQCERNKLIEVEQFYIDTECPEYNVCKIAGSVLGLQHSVEAKEKMRNAHLGRTCSVETKNKMSISHRGKAHSAEHNAKVGAKHKGKIVSPETREKQSMAKQGNVLSTEHKEKIRAATKLYWEQRCVDKVRGEIVGAQVMHVN